MISLFDPRDNQHFIERINKLTPDTKPLWGKMTVGQMLAHVQVPLRVSVGDEKHSRDMMGVVFGKVGKKQMVSEKPFKKNLPTSPKFKIREDKDFHEEKKEVIELVKRFGTTSKEELNLREHPFFGKLTADEWDLLHKKHLAHHLTQFGV